MPKATQALPPLTSAALGVVDWAPRAASDKEIALRNAPQFMLANYRQRWAGRRVYQAQALDWPRWNMVVDCFPVLSTIVPDEVVNACIDLAACAAGGTELMPDLEGAIKQDINVDLQSAYQQMLG